MTLFTGEDVLVILLFNYKISLFVRFHRFLFNADFLSWVFFFCWWFGNFNNLKLKIFFFSFLLYRTVERLWSITEDLNILYKENWTRLAAQEVQVFQVNIFLFFCFLNFYTILYTIQLPNLVPSTNRTHELTGIVIPQAKKN